MNQITAQEVAKQAAQEAVKAFHKEMEKGQKSRNFRNTKKLMSNYNAIKTNVEEGVSDIKDTEIDYSDELDEDELFISSIRRSRFRSAIMVSHVDAALGHLKMEQERKQELEKYCVFTYYFFDEMSYESAAEIYDCSVITARRWVNEMLRELSVYLFGIDGLQLE